MIIPVWMLTIIGGVFAVLLAVIGYLLRFVVAENQKKNEEQDARIQSLHDAWSTVGVRFAEAERDSVIRFVGKEEWTREYVTLTNRIDAAFKKLDRITEKGSGSSPR